MPDAFRLPSRWESAVELNCNEPGGKSRITRYESRNPKHSALNPEPFPLTFHNHRIAFTENRLDSLRNLHVANWDVAFATAFATLVTGNFLIGLILYLGGSDYEIGLATAIPSFIGIVQVPGAVWGQGFPYFKRFIAPGGLIWRALYVPLVFLPFMPFSGQAKIVLLLACIGVAAGAVQLVNPTYNDWLAKLVPSTSRGWYFSRRTLIATVAGVVAGFGGGVALDYYRKIGQEGLGYSVIFGAAVVFAAVSMVFFLRMKESVRENPVRANMRESLRSMAKPWQDRNFRLILIFSGLFMASQTYAGGFFSAFALETLKIDFTLLQIIAVAHAVGTVAFVRIWGYLSDKYGNKPILTLTMVGTVITPGVWLVCSPDRPVWNAVVLIVFHVYNGIVWSGVSVTQLNLFMSTADPEERSSYLGTALMTTAVVGGIAPLIGSITMDSLRGPLGVEMAYKTLFTIVIVMRFAIVFILAPVREDGAVSIRKTVRQMRQVSLVGVRALRALAKSSDAELRRRAVREVGRSKFSMATGELRGALTDPSPKVRREAAIALSRLATEEAAEALLTHVIEHPELLDEDLVDALGRLRTASTEKILMGLLQDPRSILRRSAARTLARLGSTDAIPHLVSAAMDPDDIEMRRASLQALRHLEAREAGSVVRASLADPHPSVRIAAAECVSELVLESCAESVRDALSAYQDESTPELAYALGSIGVLSDVETIVKAAESCTSDTSRRRCLLGAARILGVESLTYRLMILKGFERDAAMLDVLKTVGGGKRPHLRESLEAFTSGDDALALRVLSEATGDPVILALSSVPVDEAFLVAWLSCVRRA